MSSLFSPLTIRDLELKNRVVVGPMATYSAVAGMAGDWHLTHLARFAAGGAGLVFYEATAITRQARLVQGGAGIWQDEHVPPLLRITEFLRQHGAASGIQLAHSGSAQVVPRPWDAGEDADEALRQNRVFFDLEAAGPGVPTRGGPPLHEFSRSYFEVLLDSYELAARRAAEARFDVLEIHGGVGSLLHEFLSPASNRRGDEFGGDLRSRISYPLDVVARVREVWPEERPLFYRLSLVDGDQAGWRSDDLRAFVRAMVERGVDVVDLASGSAPVVDARSGDVAGMQAETGERLGREAEVKRMLGGGITSPAQAEAALASGDLVALARQMLWSPNWPLQAARALGDDPDWQHWPHPFGWSLPGWRD